MRSAVTHTQKVLQLARKNGWLRASDTWLSDLPPIEVVSLDRVSNDAEVVMGVLDAIRDAREVECEYCSMTGSQATARRIAANGPHCEGRKAPSLKRGQSGAPQLLCRSPLARVRDDQVGRFLRYRDHRSGDVSRRHPRHD